MINKICRNSPNLSITFSNKVKRILSSRFYLSITLRFGLVHGSICTFFQVLRIRILDEVFFRLFNLMCKVAFHSIMALIIWVFSVLRFSLATILLTVFTVDWNSNSIILQIRLPRFALSMKYLLCFRISVSFPCLFKLFSNFCSWELLNTRYQIWPRRNTPELSISQAFNKDHTFFLIGKGNTGMWHDSHLVVRNREDF